MKKEKVSVKQLYLVEDNDTKELQLEGRCIIFVCVY